MFNHFIIKLIERVQSFHSIRSCNITLLIYWENSGCSSARLFWFTCTKLIDLIQVLVVIVTGIVWFSFAFSTFILLSGLRQLSSPCSIALLMNWMCQDKRCIFTIDLFAKMVFNFLFFCIWTGNQGFLPGFVINFSMTSKLCHDNGKS